jgi:hypothetical protein
VRKSRVVGDRLPPFNTGVGAHLVSETLCLVDDQRDTEPRRRLRTVLSRRLKDRPDRRSVMGNRVLVALGDSGVVS